MKTTDLLTYLDRIGPEIRAAILRFATPDSCILSTAVGRRALGKLGLHAEPLTVKTFIGNMAFVRRVEVEGWPDSETVVNEWWPTYRAWTLGLGYRDAPVRPGAWAGHVILIVEGRALWDLSIDQANRPERDLVIKEPFVIAATPRFLAAKERLTGFMGDLLVMYEAVPKDTSFAASNDWRVAERAESILRDLNWSKLED